MSIQILPARLANQIAAGEVVERPASVVKELIENSLDAGATRIDIEIEQGGAKCIRIKDNGKGVDKEQLTLALSRHATSKISHLDDLEAIVSLGFRGEALASVSSVSRLTFTSKPADQEQAWQAIAEGRDMQVNVQPAAHPIGTTVEVLDLFFNTPARRRFLKTEKTEFQHIDELIKRIALSRFEIAITLKHNNKLIRQYRAAPEKIQQEKRIASICSDQFMRHAVFFERQDQGLKISGWVSDRLSPRPLADVQYCYINGRMIRDKLVNHAIKQVYSHFLPQGMFPGYIIYIECDAKDVDVNVHPAKHEVRFHQARWVHDFISSTLNSTLQDSSLLPNDNEQPTEHAYQPPNIQNTRVENPDANYNTSPKPSGGYERTYQAPKISEREVGAYCDFVAEAYQQPVSNLPVQAANSESKIANIISSIDNEYLLLQLFSEYLQPLSTNGLLLLSITETERYLTSDKLFTAFNNGEVIAQPLLLPVRFKADTEMLSIAEEASELLSRLGFSYKFTGEFVIVSQVPAQFRHAPIASLLPLLFVYLKEIGVEQNESNIKQLCDKLSELLLEKNSDKMPSKESLEVMLAALPSLPIELLKRLSKEPDLSLLIKGFN